MPTTSSSRCFASLLPLQVKRHSWVVMSQKMHVETNAAA